MLALDVARIEAGLLLVDVDFNGSRKCLIDAQRYTPFEMGLGRLVERRQGPVRRADAAAPREAGRPERQIAGLESTGRKSRPCTKRSGCRTQVPTTASRVPVPVYRGGRQVGKATSTTWSPVLKKLIALATIDAPSFAVGTELEIEVTVEAVRHRVGAVVVPDPVLQPVAKDRATLVIAPVSPAPQPCARVSRRCRHRRWCAADRPAPRFTTSSGRICQ